MGHDCLGPNPASSLTLCDLGKHLPQDPERLPGGCGYGVVLLLYLPAISPRLSHLFPQKPNSSNAFYRNVIFLPQSRFSIMRAT